MRHGFPGNADLARMCVKLLANVCQICETEARCEPAALSTSQIEVTPKYVATHAASGRGLAILGTIGPLDRQQLKHDHQLA